MAGRWLMTISEKEQGGRKHYPANSYHEVATYQLETAPVGYAHSGNVDNRVLRCPGLLALQPREFFEFAHDVFRPLVGSKPQIDGMPHLA